MVHVAQSVGVNAVKTRLSWPCPRQPWLCPHDSGLGSHPSACSSLALSCRCFIGSRLVSQMFLLFANEISVRASISILHCVCPHKLDLTRRRVFSLSLSLCANSLENNTPPLHFLEAARIVVEGQRREERSGGGLGVFLKRKNFRENVMTGGKRKYIYLLMRRVGFL